MNVLHVEVLQKRESRASEEEVEKLVREFLMRQNVVPVGSVLSGDALDGELARHADSVALCDAEHEAGDELRPGELELRVGLVGAGAGPPQREALDGEDGAGLEVRTLPAAALHGVWESLVFEDSLKADALRFVETAFEFETRGVDARQVAWSRVLLLHGPPGTGKTSLCRALAHKLALRLRPRFPRARLLEINAHGLFSKWFAESGKIVARLFDRIQEILEDPRMLVCVLVDEVESLAAARSAAAAGLEPSDSIRAVNAVLSALDRLRGAPNALLLATSNVTRAIDAAFLDRADLARLVGPPGPRAAYAVLRGALLELMSRGVVGPREPLYPARLLEAAGWEGAGARGSLALWAVAGEAAAAGVSGRALRRLPFVARALHAPPAPARPSLPDFVSALHEALRSHLSDRAALHAPHPPLPAPAV